MKRIATLFLVVTLFYNMMGYYLMFAYKEQQAWVGRMEKTSHTDYKVMRLNASLYSFVDDTEFEDVNEDVIINKQSCHIFKKQIKDNILSLYYLPNSKKNTVNKNLNDIIDSQLFNKGNSKDSPVKKLLKSFTKDYVSNINHGLELKPKFETTITKIHSIPNDILLDGYFSLLYPPPKIA